MGRTKKAAKQPETEPAGQPAGGDGGAREAEVVGAMEQFEQMAAQLDLGEESERLVANATDWLVELIKRRPKPFDQLSQSEQRDLIAACEHNMKELVRQIVEAVARNGRTAIRCLLVGFTDKGEDIKAEIKVKAHSKEELCEAVLGLHRAKGLNVLLTVASADTFAGVPPTDQSRPEQEQLGFEAGSDEHPADDSDLVEAAEDALGGQKTPDELAQTGLQMLVPQYGLCEIRVNLKTGMVEAKHPNRDSFDIDVREATSVELAAERDRQAADFDQAGREVGTTTEQEPAQ